MLKDNFAEVNRIKLHYIQDINNEPKLLLLHGLTANAYAFNGLFEAGLAKKFSIISVDQRGRGQSSKTAFAYSIKDHALDIIGLLDHLNIDKINICGHSFGGLLATYLAYHYPERFDHVIILDAAPEMNPNTPKMLEAALSRIDHRYKNFEEFIDNVKNAPYINFWDDAMLAYYQADVATAENGSVESRSNIADITLIAIAVSKEHWHTYFTQMKQNSLMVVAQDDYTLNQPLLPANKAQQIFNQMKNATYLEVSGNHQTMLFGNGAKEIVQALIDFIKS